MPYYALDTAQDAPVSTAQWQAAAHNMRWLRARWDGVLLAASRQIARAAWPAGLITYRELPALAPYYTLRAGIAWEAAATGTYYVNIYIAGHLVDTVWVDASAATSGKSESSSPLNITTPGGLIEVKITPKSSDLQLKGVTLEVDPGDLWVNVPQNDALATRAEWYRVTGELNNMARQYYMGTLAPIDLAIEATAYGSYVSHLPLQFDPYTAGSDYVALLHATAIDLRADAKKVRQVYLGANDAITGEGADIELRSQYAQGIVYAHGHSSAVHTSGGAGDYLSLDAKDAYYNPDILTRYMHAVSLELVPVYSPAGRANCAPTGPGTIIAENDLAALWGAVDANLSLMGPRLVIGGWGQAVTPIGGGSLDLGTFLAPVRDRYKTDDTQHDYTVRVAVDAASTQDITVTITDIATGAAVKQTISIAAGTQIVSFDFAGFATAGQDFQALDLQFTATGVTNVLGALVGITGIY